MRDTVTKPYKYQVTGVRQIEAWLGRALLADEMGLGKTFQALWYAARQRAKGKFKNRPIVVVCPASLKVNWEREAMKHLKMRVTVLQGMKPPKHFARQMSRNGTYVINYEILKGWGPVLKRLRPWYLIGDEAHYLQSRTAKRTLNFRSLADGIPSVVLITGTPITNKPAELWPLLNILHPAKYPNFARYARKFCQPAWKPWGWEYKGASNLKLLNRRLLKTCMIRRRKMDVLTDLPAKRRIVVPVELSPAAMKEYKEAEDDFVRWLERTHPQRANKARRAERLVRMGYLKRLAGELKLPQTQDWIDNYLHETDGKLIVFGVHRKVLVPLTERYNGGASVLVDGSVSSKPFKDGRKAPRQAAFDAFNTRKKTRLFFGNVQAAGVGWSCTSSSTVMFAELDWRPGVHVQAEDRVHGVGRGVPGEPATVYYLIAQGTLEERLVQLLTDKQKVIDSAIDGLETGDSLNILDQLEDMLTGKMKRAEKK